jgi:L-asparaginase
VVLCPVDRRLVAGTSTGGRGFEFPGRVSDSATVAGNYASPFAAISATGIGEEIVDDALCARIETRVRDGLSLEDAGRRTFEEAKASGHRYGWIACDSRGYWCVAHTSEQMSFWVQTLDGQILSSS